MTWSIDTPVRVGPVAFAAIVETEIVVHSVGSAVAGFAEKRPLLLLQVRADGVTAIDIDGQGYEADEIDTLFPQAIARLDALLRGTE